MNVDRRTDFMDNVFVAANLQPRTPLRVQSFMGYGSIRSGTTLCCVEAEATGHRGLQAPFHARAISGANASAQRRGRERAPERPLQLPRRPRRGIRGGAPRGTRPTTLDAHSERRGDRRPHSRSLLGARPLPRDASLQRSRRSCLRLREIDPVCCRNITMKRDTRHTDTTDTTTTELRITTKLRGEAREVLCFALLEC